MSNKGAAATDDRGAPMRSGRARAGGLRDSLKQFTRDQLLVAALDSFVAVGFRATTVERIVDLAGTTAPTFYRHFASKAALIPALEERLAGEVRAVVDRLDRVERIDFPTMRAWLDDYLQMWERTHRLCAAYWEAMELDPEVAANAIPRALLAADRLTNLLARCPAERRDSARLRLALMIPLLDRAAVVSMGNRDPVMRAQLLDEFTAMLVAGLGEAFSAA